MNKGILTLTATHRASEECRVNTHDRGNYAKLTHNARLVNLILLFFSFSVTDGIDKIMNSEVQIADLVICKLLSK